MVVEAFELMEALVAEVALVHADARVPGRGRGGDRGLGLVIGE